MSPRIEAQILTTTDSSQWLQPESRHRGQAQQRPPATKSPPRKQSVVLHLAFVQVSSSTGRLWFAVRKRSGRHINCCSTEPDEQQVSPRAGGTAACDQERNREAPTQHRGRQMADGLTDYFVSIIPRVPFTRRAFIPTLFDAWTNRGFLFPLLLLILRLLVC